MRGDRPTERPHGDVWPGTIPSLRSTAVKHDKSNFRVQAARFQVLLTIFVLAVASVLPTLAHAQGCIVARSTQLTGGPESNAGYLAPHHWEGTIDYRHQYSFRHY